MNDTHTPRPIRCLVVDDEPPARDELAYILSNIDDVEVIALASTAKAALQVIHEQSPDVVFLDINMPGQDGFFVTGQLAAMASPPLVVMATAHDFHAVRAFEECAVDYVLKPFSDERIAQSVERARALLRQTQKTHAASLREELTRIAASFGGSGGTCACATLRVPVEHQGRLLLLKPEEVVLCSAGQKRVVVHTQTANYQAQCGATLDSLETRLQGISFFRAHRGKLVNLEHVREISTWENGRYLMVMDDEEHSEVPVSRAKARELKARLGL